MPRHQHPVAGRKRIGDRRLPSSGARAGEQQHLSARGAENLFQIAEQAQITRAKIMGALILHRHVHGLPHDFRHVGRAGNEKMIDASTHVSSAVVNL